MVSLGRHSPSNASDRANTIPLVVAFSSAKEWTDPNWVVEADHETMKSQFAGWSTTAQKIISMMRKNDIWALFNHPPASTYVSDAGRVCIIGDAAHATTPHKGSGAGMAIEDAFILGRLLAETLSEASVDAGKAISAAFRVYDATRRARTQHLVEDSRETGQLYDLELAGFDADKEKIKESLLTRMDWVWNHDVLDELRDAKEKIGDYL